MSEKRLDLAFSVLFPLLIFVLIFFFGLNINYFESLILIFGVPGIYLSIKNKYKIRKVAWFSFLVMIPITVIFDLVVGFGDNGWLLIKSVLPYRLLGFIPIEDLLWTFLVAYVIIIFYENFYNNKFQKNMSDRIKTMGYLLYSVTAVVIIIFIFNSTLLHIPYSYLWLGIFFWLVPIFLFLVKYKSFFASFLKTDLYFFYLYLIYEISGLKLGLYVFPGVHYIAWISVLGLSFPMEEFIFVIVFGGFAACIYYEFFTRKNLNVK